MMQIKKRIFAIPVYFVVAYLGGLLLKNTILLPVELIKFSTAYLLLLNGASMLLGLPLSIIFDLLLFKSLGIAYLSYWPLIVGIISTCHVDLIRRVMHRSSGTTLSRLSCLRSRANKKVFADLSALCHNNSRLLILFIRTIPLLPFAAASGLISLLKVRRLSILLLSALGSYIYYLTFYLFFSLGAVG